MPSQPKSITLQVPHCLMINRVEGSSISWKAGKCRKLSPKSGAQDTGDMARMGNQERILLKCGIKTDVYQLPPTWEVSGAATE
ncbi:hypothetical protein CEXT_104441 [Caerostris extrusa]|uniref:Uncharacterized protein n=1 Tax=Caerostris extrusa TaxID=172846 RepID=A0AAV4X912_CAEEX|nr:hypothetical protein CEXT_104441 [Caerostris extrusa]